MLREDAMHELDPFGGEGGVTRPTVLGTLPALHEAAVGEAVHQIGDPSTGSEDLVSDRPEEEGALVIEDLEDGELSQRQTVAGDILAGALMERGVCTRDHSKEFEGIGKLRLDLARGEVVRVDRVGFVATHDGDAAFLS